MKRITIEYDPGTGQTEVPTGAMQAGVPVEFFWHTPTLIGGFNPEGSQDGSFKVIAPSDNNAGFNGTFLGNTKAGQGASSFQWTFRDAYALKPDTDYSVVVTVDTNCAGLKGKLGPGSPNKKEQGDKHD
jgi:hypothetical protein